MNPTRNGGGVVVHEPTTDADDASPVADRRWTSDRLDGIGWAALFLWAALVVVASSTEFSNEYESWDGWSVFWLGAGVIVLVEALIRLVVPAYRYKFGWTLFWGALLLSFGLGGLFSPAWYALPLIAAAIGILAGALRGRH
jgi:hypothetical protein